MLRLQVVSVDSLISSISLHYINSNLDYTISHFSTLHPSKYNSLLDIPHLRLSSYKQRITFLFRTLLLSVYSFIFVFYRLHEMGREVDLILATQKGSISLIKRLLGASKKGYVCYELFRSLRGYIRCIIFICSALEYW